MKQTFVSMVEREALTRNSQMRQSKRRAEKRIVRDSVEVRRDSLAESCESEFDSAEVVAACAR